MCLKCKIRLIPFLAFLLFFAFPTLVSACTYKSTITNNHVDFSISTDLDKLILIQYDRLLGSSLVTKMYGANVGTPWTYFDDPNCNLAVTYPVGCRQHNASGILGDSAVWQWTYDGYLQYHILPGSLWGFDFDIPPTNSSIGIRIATTDGWFSCTRSGDIEPPQSTPPQLTVIKNVINDNGGNLEAKDFTININDNIATPSSFIGSESGTLVSLSPGSYSVSETVNSGYSTTYSSNCTGTVVDGDTKTCTVTNDDIAPTITLTNNVINDDEGTFGPNDFEIKIGNNIVASGSKTSVLANNPIVITQAGHSGYDFVSITGTGCPTELGQTVILNPGQDINCTITNNDIEPTLPVTKVVFIPGFGGSWNVDALINCKNSGYSGSWTLAPYAKDVYNSFLTKLPTQGWSSIPFYYDWRQEIKKTIPQLTSLINSSVTTNEKVNLVGHSMGGVIGGGYLASELGGKASKFLAVGAPIQGVSIAYPAVINGEIWVNDLVERIAATLLFQHCGVPKSFNDLLPTYNYIRDARTDTLKSVTSMKTQNKFLPINFVNDFWGVKVGTLAGKGQSTLDIIKVNSDHKWPDGKPTSKEYSNEGDGTVLLKSAQISNAVNDVINQSHSGVIASDEGIDRIFKFLGSPGISDPPYVEPTSALVLVGYPGSFSLTDNKGKVTTSEDGIISIMNPNDGNYQLQITPASNTTNFIISQFLPNGKTEYKEYKFKGSTIEPKIIEYNSKLPKTDCLREHKDYSPKFWIDLLKFWNKFHK